ncbi:MAG: tyrosine-type recombinase/integrase [Candidatus Pacearchaeota archaeon]|jgi:integrase
MKIDPYDHKKKYLSWKSSINGKIPEISEQNSQIILDYVFDMEHGLNVSNVSKKGARGYPRMNNLKQRIIFLVKLFEEKYDLKDITQVSERTLHDFFTKMRNGDIRRLDGQVYQSSGDYVKVFKAFWHWYQKSSRKKGIEVFDLTIDLDASKEKPKWVYLTEDQVKRLVDNAKFDYKVLIMFLYDSGIRSPTELMNVKVSDFYNNFKELNIRDEISKTFGRRIKLMLCPDLIKRYVEEKKLKEEDYLFTTLHSNMNKYLKRLSTRIFGDAMSPAGQRYSELTLYDFRHCSCCYWLPRYKSESALKFRFGWKKSDKIHYYSEMLGMRDTISDEDLLVDLTKTEIEKRLLKSENEKNVLQERVDVLEKQMKIIAELVKKGVWVVSDD